MKNFNKLFVLLLVALSTLCVYSCSKDEIEPDPTPVRPDGGAGSDSESDSESDTTEDYFNIVKNNVSTTASYEDYTATFIITSRLKSQLTNKSIEYGIGHKDIYNSKDVINNSVGNDAYYYSERETGNTEIITIKIPFWFYYVFVEKDESKWADCEAYYRAYIELKEKDVSKLASDEKSLYDTCIKYLNKYENEVKSYYKMAVQVVVNTNFITIAEYKITDLKEGNIPNVPDDSNQDTADSENENNENPQAEFESFLSRIKIEPETFSAKISGTLTPVDYSTYKSIEIRYGTSYGLPTYSKIIITVTGMSFSEILSNLSASSEYYYRVIVTDNDGKTYTSDIGAFTTNKPRVPSSCTYTIDGMTFKMVKVTGLPTGDFYIMQTELPIEASFEIEGHSLGSLDQNADNCIIKVEFTDFLTKLKSATNIDFRLPTSAEWIYAAAGGQNSKGYIYSGSDNLDEVGWYAGNSGNLIHMPAKLKPNELGLYDMSGNLAEIVVDPSNPTGIDGNGYGGYYKSQQSQCTPKSFISQPSSGMISGASVNEKNAFDGKIYTVRLVYSAN